MTFRKRLLLASLSTLAVGITSLLVLGNVLLGHQADTQTRDLLRERATTQIAALEITGGRIVPREVANDDQLDRRAWVFSGGDVVERPASVGAAVDRAASALGHAGGGERTVGDTALLAQAIPDPDDTLAVPGTVVVSVSVASVERLEASVLTGSIVAAVLLMIAGTMAIRRALTGALEPVARMTEQVTTWEAQDLDQRFGLGPARDELTGLAATLDGLLGRIAASRRHEQRFAAELAHELRTPLAALGGRAQLALADGAGDAQRRQALVSVLEQTSRLTGTVETLLALARREIDPSEGTVDLADVARDFDGLQVEASDDVLTAEGDAQVVRRALAPLIDNAQRYARSGVTVSVFADESTVTARVRDDGPGIAPSAGDVFDPGTRGPDSPGAGLGLPLARRLARSCGGDVVVGPGPGGCMDLRLPRLR